MNKMTLEEFISRLELNQNVDSLAVTGSAGTGNLNPASDYDFLIVVNNKPPALLSGAAEIGGRFADLGFTGTEEIKTLIEGSERALPLNGRFTTMIRSLREARILFDKSGLLTGLQKKYLEGIDYFPPQRSELISRLDRTSYNLAHTQRKASSSDPDYLMAVDMRMLYQLDNLMVDYFFVRGRPWPGEKEAVRYWKASDPDYYELFRKCLYETGRSRRMRFYEQLAAETMKPAGALWHTGETRFRLHPETEMTAENLEAAETFWLSLFE